MESKPLNTEATAQTAPHSGAERGGEQFDDVIVLVNVTAYTSGSLLPVVDAYDGTSWHRLYTGAAISGAGATAQKFGPLPSRWRAAITGTFVGTYTYKTQPIKYGRP